MMSHELRTPLNAIGGYAEMLELGARGPITEGRRTSSGSGAASHLLGFINNMLNFAKLDAGQIALDVVVHLVSAVDELGSLVLPQPCQESTFTVRRPQIAPRGAGDPEKVRQILLNLLSNAVKFTDRGGR